MICPVCQQEVSDTGLGTALPHRRGDSEEYCPGFVPKTFVTAPSDTALDSIPIGPLTLSLSKGKRKVRSDKGTKRGQRKTVGPEAAPGGPPSQEPERVAAYGQVAQVVEQGPYKPPVDEYEGKRTPREGYIAATPNWLPLIRTFEEARDLATRCCAQGEPSYVFHVIPIRKLESGIKETRLGRVRRQKAKS